jgi:hypothetical protein
MGNFDLRISTLGWNTRRMTIPSSLRTKPRRTRASAATTPQVSAAVLTQRRVPTISRQSLGASTALDPARAEGLMRMIERSDDLEPAPLDLTTPQKIKSGDRFARGNFTMKVEAATAKECMKAGSAWKITVGVGPNAFTFWYQEASSRFQVLKPQSGHLFRPTNEISTGRLPIPSGGSRIFINRDQDIILEIRTRQRSEVHTLQIKMDGDLNEWVRLNGFRKAP